MSDSSEEEFSTDWIPYCKRKEWEDLKGIPQDDGENPVVAIAYSAKFKDVYNYFRAILKANEKSERALELTSDALKLNPANYTVWQYRRDILKALNKNLNVELESIADVIIANPKNYQVWHHRRVLVEWLNDPSQELQLTEVILNLDAKNYHAWQHRQWALKTFDLFEYELFYIERLIIEDVRNNSAWNQRFFALKHFGFTTDIIEREIIFVESRIELAKNNESSWNYLRGILTYDKGSLTDYPEVEEFCESLYNNQIRTPYFLSFLIDLYQEKCLKNKDLQNELSKKVYDLCDAMAKEYDVIRRKYWIYVAERFKAKLNNVH